MRSRTCNPPRRLNRGAMGSLAQGLVGLWVPRYGERRVPNLAFPGKTDLDYTGMDTTVQVAASSAGNGTGTAPTVSGLGTVGSSDVLIAVISCISTASITAASGWSLITGASAVSTAANNNVRVGVYWVRGTPSSYDFTLSSSVQFAWSAVRLTGVTGSGDPWDVVGTYASSGDVTTITNSAITTTVTNTFLVQAAGFNDGTSTATLNSPNGNDLPWTLGNVSVSTGSRYVGAGLSWAALGPSGSTGSVSVSQPGSGRAASVLIALKGTAPGPSWGGESVTVNYGGRFFRPAGMTGFRGVVHDDHRAAPLTLGWAGWHRQAGANDWDTKFGIFHGDWSNPQYHAVIYDRQGWGATGRQGMSTNDGTQILILDDSTNGTALYEPQTLVVTRPSGSLQIWRNGRPYLAPFTAANLPTYVQGVSTVYFGNAAPKNGYMVRQAYADHLVMAMWSRVLTASEIARWHSDPWVGLR